MRRRGPLDTRPGASRRGIVVCAAGGVVAQVDRWRCEREYGDPSARGVRALADDWKSPCCVVYGLTIISASSSDPNSSRSN